VHPSPITLRVRLSSCGRAPRPAHSSLALNSWQVPAAYRLLGLQTYFTAGPAEVRAWTIPVGARAPQAAGVIHGDFEKNFIRAEAVGWAQLVEAGSEKAAKEKGLWRSEGKDYVVQEGDVLLFRHNG